jgi:hypothetical protein
MGSEEQYLTSMQTQEKAEGWWAGLPWEESDESGVIPRTEGGDRLEFPFAPSGEIVGEIAA